MFYKLLLKIPYNKKLQITKTKKEYAKLKIKENKMRLTLERRPYYFTIFKILVFFDLVTKIVYFNIIYLILYRLTNAATVAIMEPILYLIKGNFILIRSLKFIIKTCWESLFKTHISFKNQQISLSCCFFKIRIDFFF